MKLVPGARLGPYEILGAVGAGGMGEVYRARDPRLGRDVALKILAAVEDQRPDRLRRFEQEARAVAALNHPHILAVHDVGSADGMAYVVFELLEGQTLRERLDGGAIPLRKAVEYGEEIARGLSAAHARGVIHRDLKPANLFLTRDGQVKILDFGLAKLTGALETDEALESETYTATDSGIVVGTAGYISPEQARGQHADARSDVFALGAVLYEMVAGRPAFDGATSADRVSAVLHRDPPELIPGGRESVSPGLDRMVRRCLEKDPEERFQSARDVAFALDALGSSGMQSLGSPTATPRRRFMWLATAVVACAGAATAGLYAGRVLFERPLPSIRQLTFARGTVTGAHFLPSDERTVLYSASWDGGPNEIFLTRVDGPESRSLGLPPARLLSVSSRGELAILLTRPEEVGDPFLGTLAQVPLAGGVPRPVLEDVANADWSADGNELAVVRKVGAEGQLEYPIGRVLLRSLPPYAALRVSPDSDKVAVETSSGIAIVDRKGNLLRSLKPSGPHWGGFSWAPAGDAVWVTSGPTNGELSVWRLALDGSRRQLYIAPGTCVLRDVAKSGAALLHHGIERSAVRVKARGEPVERELDLRPTGVVNWASLDISPDGTHALTTTPEGASYLHSALDEDPLLVSKVPVILGIFGPARLSPDGKWLLDGMVEKQHEARLVPIGPGQTRSLPLGPLRNPSPAFLDARRLYWLSRETPDAPPSGFVQDIETGAIRAVTPPGVEALWSSLVDEAVLGRRESDGTLVWCPLGGGTPRLTSVRIPSGTVSLQTSADGRWLFVNSGGIPTRIDRIDLHSGQRELWKSLAPPDLAGVVLIDPWIPMTSDGEAYAYHYERVFQDLFLVEGLR